MRSTACQNKRRINERNRYIMLLLHSYFISFISLQLAILLALLFYFMDISFSTLVLAAAILAFSYLFYSLLLKPYREYRFYKSIVSLNYKAYIYPFTIFPTSFVKTQNESLQKYGDSQHACKTIFPQYQLVIEMMRGSVFLNLVDAQLIRQFYERVLEGCYVKSEKFIYIVPFKITIGKGLLHSEHEEWRRKRKIMSTVFNYDFIRAKVKIISNIAKEVLDSIEANQENCGKNEIVMDVNTMLQEFFGYVVIRCFFGDLKLSNIRGKPVFNFFNDLMELNVQRSRSLMGLILGGQFFKYNLRPIDRQANSQSQQFKQYTTKLVSEYMQAQSQNILKKQQTTGVIEMLIKQGKLRGNNQNDKTTEETKEDQYSINDLLDQFKNFFFGGTDTTSNNTSILIYELSKHKQVQEKVRKEIFEVLQNKVENITFEKLKQLKYLQKVQKQILRMYIPTPRILGREAIKDHFLGKIPIKKGVMLTVSIVSRHFDKNIYKDPEVFNPDRWDNDPSKIDPFAYFPFSSGLRNCIGQHLALIETKIIVIHLLIRYKDLKLEKPEYRKFRRALYGAEKMKTTFIK